MNLPTTLSRILNPLFTDINEDELETEWKDIDNMPPEQRLYTGLLEIPGQVQCFLTRPKLQVTDMRTLEKSQRQKLVEKTFQTSDQDNERLLLHCKQRIDRARVSLPTVEVRFEGLTISAEVYVGNRALPTLPNFVRNMWEGFLEACRLIPSNKQDFIILNGVSGVVKPGRMLLALGPPGCGKSTLLKALAGKHDKGLKVHGAGLSRWESLFKSGPQHQKLGSITYNGHDMTEFIAERTSAYVSQNDNHIGELTVRETLDFAARCMGVGYNLDLLKELIAKEMEDGVHPDPEIDAFMKGIAIEGAPSSLSTDYILKLLGLDICADTLVGNEMLRGISGGQKKRVTTGEMIVGPKRVMFMDEISTGLDSSTTFQVVKCLRNITHTMEATVMIALLQPAPETYELFDEVLLMSEGLVVYLGPRDGTLEFFETLGFKLPPRKGIADFLQEVTSKKDQKQYWADKDKPYIYISVEEMAAAFKAYPTGQELASYMETPFERRKSHPAALVRNKYALTGWQLVKACTEREMTLIKRNAFLYIFRTCQVGFVGFVTSTLFIRARIHPTDEQFGNLYLGSLFFALIHMMFNGFSEMAMTVLRLPVLYKQRDNYFFPTWTFTFPCWLLRVPYSIAEAIIWSCMVYYVIGLAPSATRFFRYMFLLLLMHQMALGLFRLIGALGRTMVIANTFGTFALIVVFLLGGFILSKDSIHNYWEWGYWVSPLSYAQNAIAVNEFLDNRWNKISSVNNNSLSLNVLLSRGLKTKSFWYWIGVGVLIAYTILFNFMVTYALKYLDPLGQKQASMPESAVKGSIDKQVGEGSQSESATTAIIAERVPNTDEGSHSESDVPARSAEDTDREDLQSVEANLSSFVHSGGAVEITPGTKMYLERVFGTSVRSEVDLEGGPSSEQTPRAQKGMIIPFKPLSLTFRNVNYYVDMPPHLKEGGTGELRLHLLKKVSGGFRPGVLTALVGVSGAGKTTLMDVLAGRKTGGYIDGDIRVSGFTKRQDTFARISGYVEQNDIHSPQVTVYESLIYSSWLRLPDSVQESTRLEFVQEVMDLVELASLKGALVGLPGSTGLSTEQRKRLTIAVELVANPSIIFMDEPTSGLDARAAAIVMRTVRNTVDTGRTVVCTIHQPSIDIFEAFDELLLMKRGGQVIYSGPLGTNSELLIKYFQAVDGVTPINDGYNPATWMLEITSPANELRIGKDFAKIYAESERYRSNDAVILECNIRPSDAKDLEFPTQYSRDVFTQVKACLWKQHLTYWRSPYYNAVRFFFTITVALIFGSIFYGIGAKRTSQTAIFNVMGALYAAVLFMGVNNAASVQPIVSVERTVFYRERAAGMYGPLPYALAQAGIEIPYIFVQTLIYGIITYAMIKFEWTAAKFFWYLLFMFMTFTYFTFYGMMAVGLTPSQPVAAVVSSAFYSLWNLFSGFLIPRPRIPGWWVWFYWISPVAWTLYGLITSQLGDVEFIMEAPGYGSLMSFVYISYLGAATTVNVSFY
ncbi:hypothetical protein Mp_2g03890 [Marchantia polymorpha subsp. ruderalis]|uniref:ABC transporter domain-containing protein n=1 Tax=Marchantia polymorpha TaxID=3197 RepID=A0A2R6X7H3_MARPO|nr:hypothetical protein MARPO_0031s0045 [Marchantia polymorpha]BBN01006.1 hypothetical protein Mp_2g03890 [Marchantia polymorpha subsp. ruderalis]|eukprot:PTQ42056.1 hypothetical protein MARPO_0031s0045 [Marchantia polymorpha]